MPGRSRRTSSVSTRLAGSRSSCEPREAGCWRRLEQRCRTPLRGVRHQGLQLAPQLLDLVAELRRVLEAQLLRGDVHLFLERDDELLELLARHAFDLLRAPATPRRDVRRFER